MSNSLKVVAIQINLHWEDKKANLSLFDNYLNSIKDQNVDLIILPELFTTGFSMKPELFAENSNDSNTLQWMQNNSKLLNAAICGSIIIQENNSFYNRLYFVKPDGVFYSYDKRHLFAYGNEHHHYTAGSAKLIVEWKGWKICPLICYDLRFPVWSRNTEDYDLLIYVANWPQRRSHAWKSLLVARAIENQTYCIGVNRVGVDGNQIYHSGDSMAIDFLGEILVQESDKNCTILNVFEKEKLINFRSQFPFLADRDIFLTKF